MGPGTFCRCSRWPSWILQQHCCRKHRRVQVASDGRSHAREPVRISLTTSYNAKLLLLCSSFCLINIAWRFRYLAAFVLYIGCNAMLAAAAAALCAYIAPAAAGSGIPEVKAYLNGVDAHSILAPSTLLVKVVP